MPKDILCPMCGARFEPRKGSGGRPQRYCSTDCRQAASRVAAATRERAARVLASEIENASDLARWWKRYHSLDHPDAVASLEPRRERLHALGVDEAEIEAILSGQAL